MTNRGLSATFHLIQWTLNTYAVTLQCSTSDFKGRIYIVLRRTHREDTYCRTRDYNGFELFDESFEHLPLQWGHRDYRPPSMDVPLFVYRSPMELMPTSSATMINGLIGFRIPVCFLHSGLLEDTPSLQFLDECADQLRNEQERTILLRPGACTFGQVAHISIADRGFAVEQVKLGFDFGFNPVIIFATSSAIPDLEPTTSAEHSLTELERDNMRSFSKRLPNDKMDWFHASLCPFYGPTSNNNGDRRAGLWQVKGDRLGGFSDNISGTYTPVRLKLNPANNGKKIVWDLEIENLEGLGVEWRPQWLHTPEP